MKAPTRRAVLCATAPLLLSEARPQGYVAHPRSETLEVNGVRRRFRLVSPPAPQNAPIVIAFHGVQSSPGNMARLSHLDEVAQTEGWLLAYPGALGQRWPYFSEERTAGDVQFSDLLISQLIERGGDPNRVYLTGMSGGGFFCNVVGSRLSERIASVAAHSGGAGFLARDGINATHKYPVMVIHGIDDDIVPIESGRNLAALYRHEGHRVEMVEYPRWGHAWAAPLGVNERIADFFRRTPRS